MKALSGRKLKNLPPFLKESNYTQLIHYFTGSSVKNWL